MEEEIKYEKIFKGIVSEKVKVAQKFKENSDILENMKKWNNLKEEPPLYIWDPVTGLYQSNSYLAQVWFSC